MYFYTFNGIPQTLHPSKESAQDKAILSMNELKEKFNIEWVCHDTFDNATTLRKWNVLHGAEHGFLGVTTIESHGLVLGFNLVFDE